LQSMIKMMRINKFVSNMQTNKRQRKSVSYFRRYTVDELDVKIDKRRKQENLDLVQSTTPA